MKRLLLLLTLVTAINVWAGGPAYVAGKGGFNAGLMGTPVRWATIDVVYYTDQGDLSALTQQNSINALVADAFSRWTSVPTVALTATRAGSLAEDVSGANVTLAGTSLIMPADIQPTSSKPIAFVYDADGAVTDALLGAGASKLCTTNFVFGGPDQFTADAHIQHALVVLNGSCVKTTADIPVLRYHLVRAIGRALGLGWSQANDQVNTKPPASITPEEAAGYPVMHPVAALCAPGAGCMSNADQLRMDDRMAISRLYPVTPTNVSSFSGKTVFSAATARVSGTVWFGTGTSAAAIQGVNVVARLIDPSTNLPSQMTVGTSVSGFLYRGNAGNIVTGFTDATGQRYDRWGSDDPSLRGYFDLAGLEIPAGSSAKYEITVERLSPQYTGGLSVGPIGNTQVSPPGTAARAIVTVSAGSALVQDVPLNGTAIEGSDLYEPHSFDSPRQIPGAGIWGAALSEIGDVDWNTIAVRAYRSFTIDVTAIDAGAPTASKALPVIGIWNASATESDAPVLAQTYLNAASTGVTRLQTSLPTGSYKIAIADARGDGRPDFLYSARVLYADTVAPSHALGGTVLTITGLGFSADLRVKIGTADAPLLAFVPGEIKVSAPMLADGTYALTIDDPTSGASASIENAVSYGGAGGATLQLLNGDNPPVPVGTPAPNPFRVRVLASDGTTPVAGASVRFLSPSASVVLQPCNTQDCTVASDGAGEARIWMVVKAAGSVTISASLRGGASTWATVTGVSTPLAVEAAPPKIYIPHGSAASVPLLVRVVGNGTPLSGRFVEYSVMLGNGTLSAATTTTDGLGEASTTLNITNMASEIRVSACVGTAPQTACDVFYMYSVAVSGGTRLVKTAGDEQYIGTDEMFQPVMVRLNDLSDPPNTVAGAPVTFRMTAYQVGRSSRTMNGEVLGGHFGGPTVVASQEVTLYTNGWGEAQYLPNVGGAGLLIEVHVVSGTSTADFTLHTWELGQGTRAAGQGTKSDCGILEAANCGLEKPPPRLSISPSALR